MSYRSLPVVVAGFQALAVSAQVVINEIHYDPDLKTERVEFIELHNRDATPVDLGGWSFTEGINFTFPAGVSLGAGGYVVLGENPAALTSKFGVTAHGPWVGGLANEGERITLRRATGEVADTVEYRLGFPWPTVGDPPGYSIELIHPGLDNDLGGSWRASVAGNPEVRESVIIPERSSWRYFKGVGEPSSPSTAWRALAFDDSSWPQGPGPIGYDPALPMGTFLGDMPGGYTTVFFRSTFTVTNRAEITSLTLAALYDDGFKVWINESNVLNANISSGELPHTGTAGPPREDGSYNTFTLNSPQAYLRDGANVIAIQAANSSLTGSSDFYLDLRLSSRVGPSGRGPTPGALNSAYATVAPPQLRQVRHAPDEPRSGEPVRITVKATDPDGVAEVKLFYQVVDPGNYIALTDAAYATDWQETPMRDDGTDGDAWVGDGIYTAELPGTVQQHRRLVRYRIVAADSEGASVRAPYGDDPQPNFAYYVYDGVPAWSGAVRPGAGGAEGQVFTASPARMNALPVYHLLSKKDAVWYATGWQQSGPGGSLSNRYTGDLYHWPGTLVYDGRVYDHIRYRARGGVWRYSMVKNMWKFDFNRGHDFEARDNWGRKYRSRWTKLNLGASIQQGDYQHRGEQGMFESVGFRLFELAGVPAPRTTFVQLRIVDEPAEQDPTTQYEGDFWGLYLVTEQENGWFLDEHGLPDSNFYKMEGGSGELNNLGPYGPADKSDLNQLLSAYNNANDTWWRANWDLPKYYRYQSIVQAIHHYDISFDKNYFYYTNSATGRWEVMPWDLDLTWAHNMFHPDYAGVDRLAERILNPTRVPGSGVQSGTYVMRLTGTRPAFDLEFRNQVREVRDLLFNADQGYALIDEYAGTLRGTQEGPGMLEADRAQWDYNPKMASSSFTPHLSKAGQGRFYQFPLESGTNSALRGSFAATVQIMKNYVNIRGVYLDELAHDPEIPARPTLTYLGPPGYPLNGLRFRTTPFSGSHAFAALEWRLGEVADPAAPAFDPGAPRPYEIEAKWHSGQIAPFANEITLPVDSVRVGNTYRVRVRMRDSTGRYSSWSTPAQFVVGPSDNVAALVEHLRVTEVMPEPTAGSDFEFVELYNASGELALDLTGVKFTSGIDFTFPAAASLPPQSYLLVVPTADFAAFRAHYALDETVALAGPYAGSLANEGEAIVLKTAAGGTDLAAFEYGNALRSVSHRGWPLAAAGAGHSLVPLARAMPGRATGALDYPGNWRASTYLGGSPGGADPEAPLGSVRINEFAAHTDYSNPQRPEYDSNDWIELYNASAAPASLEHWYLSDRATDLRLWKIPAQTLDAGQWITFDEVSGFHNPITAGFGLNKAGEQIYLSHLPETGKGGVVDAVRFEGQENDRTWGRYPDGGEYGGALNPTRHSANSPPERTVLLSEVMYAPPRTDGVTDNVADEYVELFNPTDQPLDLFSANGVWRLEGGVDWSFAPGTQLAAGEALLVVGFDPANSSLLDSFLRTYGLEATSIKIQGPYSGKLSNRSDRLALERPQSPDLPGDPYSWVIVDEVIYGNQAPWPETALGTGLSLHRLSAGGFGNDPANWQAASPTPGMAALVSDRDQDGMPDAWEDQHGFDPDDPTDAARDADGDGLTNLEEYRAGTDPNDQESLLRFSAVARTDAGVRLEFASAPGRTYQVEYGTGLPAAAWTLLAEVTPQTAPAVEVVIDPAPLASSFRCYRLRLVGPTP
ncbi:MAG: lamin tail domain-containing protein [Verrucomicrobia bacterium]|nr:lamin tail domain-containing protein [Verrucomicrobiota bacterium]